MRFILDQRDARQVIEIVDRSTDHAFLQRFEQQQEFLDRDRDLGVLQRKEKIDQHDKSSASAGRRALQAGVTGLIRRGLSVSAIGRCLGMIYTAICIFNCRR